MIGHGYSLGKALRLVIYTPGTDRIYIAPISLWLGVHLRITVDFRGAGQEKLSFFRKSQAESVMGPERIDLERFNRQLQIIHWRRRRGKVNNPIQCTDYMYM